MKRSGGVKLGSSGIDTFKRKIYSSINEPSIQNVMKNSTEELFNFQEYFENDSKVFKDKYSHQY